MPRHFDTLMQMLLFQNPWTIPNYDRSALMLWIVCTTCIIIGKSKQGWDACIFLHSNIVPLLFLPLHRSLVFSSCNFWPNVLYHYNSYRYPYFDIYHVFKTWFFSHQGCNIFVLLRFSFLPLRQFKFIQHHCA